MSWQPPTEFPDLSQAKVIAIDCETRDERLLTHGPGGARGKDGYVVGVSVATDDGIQGYWPIRHEEGPNLDETQVLAWLRDSLGNEQPKVGANILYDLEWLRAEGVTIRGPKWDIQIAEPLLDEELKGYSLEALSNRHLGESKREEGMIEAAERLGIKEKDVKGNIWRLPSTAVGPYGEGDAELAMRIWQIQRPKLQEEGLWEVFELETRLVDLLLEMRFQGVPVNVARAEEIRDRLHVEFEATQKRLRNLARSEVDIWSWKTLAPICDRLGLSYGFTPEGNPSFPAAWLGQQEADFFKLLLKARKLDRSGGVFVEKKILDLQCNGRLHPTFRQVRGDDGGTRSGRFSSKAPNLQQVPSRDPYIAPLIRSIFVPEDGCQWLSADHCFSEDTEVLTDSGFKLFKDLKTQDMVAQYEDGEIDFAVPKEYQRSEYSGDMVHAHTDRHFDMLVTPEHTCLLKLASGNLRHVYAKDYDSSRLSTYQINSGMCLLWEGRTLPYESISLICAIQADAAIRKKANGGVNNIRFYVKKDRKIQRLREILRGVEHTDTEIPSKPGFRSFNILARHVPGYVWEFLEHTPEKCFKRTLLTLSVETRQVILEEVRFWDGSKNYYCSTIRQNSEVIQEIAIMTNMRSKLSTRCYGEGRKPLYVATLPEREITETNLRHVKKDLVHYSGIVYCVSMPRGTVVVRRNGCVSITCQSQQEPRVTVHYAAKMGLPGAEDARRRYLENPKTDYHEMTRQMSLEKSGHDIGRRTAKDLNLGMAYGQGKAGVAEKLGLTIEQANNLLEIYHSSLPYVKRLGYRCRDVAQQRGWVKTLLGRKCRFNKWGSGTFGVKSKPLTKEEAIQAFGSDIARWGTHKAMNRIIQGSSADMIKKNMVDLFEQGLIPHITIHDELAFSVEGDEQIRQIIETMETSVELLVPLLVEGKVGPSWGELTKYERD